MFSKRFLYITIFTFITVAIWITFDILHSKSQVTIPAETQQLIEPISPEFDTEVLNNLWTVSCESLPYLDYCFY